MLIHRWTTLVLERITFQGRSTSRIRKTRRRLVVAPRFEQLEMRSLLSATPATTFNPTAIEQMMLYDTNHVRIDPQGELKYLFTSTSPTLVSPDANVNYAMQAFSVSTSDLLTQWHDLVPTAPLDWSPSLYSSAGAHNAVMIRTNSQTHQAAGEPDIGTRMRNAGYSPYWYGENIFAYSNTEFYGDSGFLIDWGNAEPGHRDNIMNPQYRDVGINITVTGNSYPSTGPLVITQDFASPQTATNPDMVGVVYKDTNHNGRYDSGEGIGGATITIVGPTGTFTTTSMTAGGWQYPVAAGNYTVSVSGGTFLGTSSVKVTMGSANREVDFISGVTSGYVDFKIPNVNHAPVGTSHTVTTLEDTAYTFSVTNFGFTDPSDTPANSLAAILMTSVPTVGTFSDNGIAIRAGTKIPVADITSGKLKFAPAKNANGANLASFKFQIQDNGGTANGGIDTDPTARLMTINVTSVNDAPVGTAKTVTKFENTAYTLTTANFGFTDPSDVPANAFAGLKVTTLPLVGTLTDNGVAVVAGASIPVADITAGKFKYASVANKYGAGYASFTFQVQDNGGTTSGGINTDTTARKLTINVTAVNSAPIGTAKTVSTLENKAYVFKLTDFGFTDPNDLPANTLLSVKITTLPTAGSLTINGVAATVGIHVPLIDFTYGWLKFTPAANKNGVGYSSFTFQVQDNGGTANGGLDTDVTPRKMIINVTSVNSAPVGTATTVTALMNSAYVFKATDFGFTDPNDVPANALLAVKITTIPLLGKLTDNGVAVLAGAHISAADIVAGKLKFTPVANKIGAPYTSFTFQVQDNGGTANGGIDTDLTARKMTINVR